jgi:hypothetical protein
MCMVAKSAEQKEADRRKQFTDAGYTGGDDLWVSVGDPNSERVYEGEKPARFTRSSRIYYGDAFVPEPAAKAGAAGGFDQLAGLGRSKSPFSGTQQQALNRGYGFPEQQGRGRYEIVLDGAYDDPSIENLADPFYKSWGQKFSATPTEQLPDAAKLVAEDAKKKAAQTKVITPAGSIASSFMSAAMPSMQTDDNRYNNIGLAKQVGVSNLVGRR